MKSKLIMGLIGAAAVFSPQSKAAETENTGVFKKTPFEAVMAKLEPGGDVFSYYKSDEVIGAVTGFLVEFFKVSAVNCPRDASFFQFLSNLIENSGVNEIDAVGESLLQTGDETYSSRFYIYHDSKEPQGLLWNALAKKNEDFSEFLQMVPENSGYASYNTLNLKAVFEWIKDQIEAVDDPQIQQKFAASLQMVELMTGKKVEEILDTLQNQMLMILTIDPDETFEFVDGRTKIKLNKVNYCLAAKVKDSTIFDLFAKFIPKTKMALETENGVSYLKSLDEPAGGYIIPTFVQTKDMFLFSTNKAIADEVIAGNSAGFKQKDRLKGLPVSGIGFEYLGPELGDLMNFFIEKVTESSRRGKKEANEIFAENFAKKLFEIPTAFTVSQVDSNGLSMLSHTSQGVSRRQMASAITVPAVLAAIAVPSLSQNRARAQELVKESNEKMVTAALCNFLANNPDKEVNDVIWKDIKPFLNEGCNTLEKLKVGSVLPFFDKGKLVYNTKLSIEFLSLRSDAIVMTSKLAEAAIATANMNFSKRHHSSEDKHLKIVDGKSLVKVMGMDIGKEWKIKKNSLTAVLSGKRFIITVKSPETKDKQASIGFVIE